jgi:hypothetical protein
MYSSAEKKWIVGRCWNRFEARAFFSQESNQADPLRDRPDLRKDQKVWSKGC